MVKLTSAFVGVLGVLCLQFINTTNVSAQTKGTVQVCPNANNTVQELSLGIEENGSGDCFFFYSNMWKSDIKRDYCFLNPKLKFVGVAVSAGVIQCKYKLSNDKVKNYPVRVQPIKNQTGVPASINWYLYDNKNSITCVSEDVNQCPFYFNH